MAANSSTDDGANQYGGNHRAGWLKYIPDSWLPFVQLTRLVSPTPVFLVFSPHFFGLLHAAILTGSPPTDLFYTGTLIFVASFFLSNALHIWDDLIDAPLDALIERTRHRPIPRGAISKSTALIFTATQAVGAALFLPLLPTGFIQSALYSIPGIAAWAYYPWAKRHTYYPQLVLGFALGWGIIMGSLAGGLIPFTINLDTLHLQIEPSSFCLVGVTTVWTMIYDTIYAQLDLEEDKKTGVKSLAVLYEGRAKSLFSQLLAAMAALLITCGRLSGASAVYYAVAVFGSIASLGLMVWKVDLKNSESCYWWFGNGFWFAGAAITAGLLLELLLA